MLTFANSLKHLYDSERTRLNCLLKLRNEPILGRLSVVAYLHVYHHRRRHVPAFPLGLKALQLMECSVKAALYPSFVAGEVGKRILFSSE